MARDLTAEALDRFALARSSSGQTNVGGLDSQPVHVVQDLDLGLDGGIRDRRALQSVAQRLVVQLDRVRGLSKSTRPGLGPESALYQRRRFLAAPAAKAAKPIASKAAEDGSGTAVWMPKVQLL